MNHYQFEPTQATCPICSNSQAQILWSVNSEQAARHYVVEAADPQRFSKLVAQIERLWQQDTCDVVRCESCGFCYSHPYVAGDEEFYTLAYERDHYPGWKWEYQRTYDTLKQRADFTLLEIGAGEGAFVKRIAPELTEKENVVCTEFSDYGISQIRDYGIQCLPKDVRAIQSEDFQGCFDVICMFQVLEHMDQLDALFQHLNWLTKNNASLFISVPNPNHVEFSELNGGLLDMPPNHIGRWNRQSFETIGACWGWHIQQFETESTNFIFKAVTFYKYRFWRKGQQPGSLANRIVQVKNPSLSKLLRAVGAGFYILSDLSALNALRSKDLGLSLWVHLKKMG